MTTELQEHEAVLNITINGMNGDFVDPIPFDAPDDDIKLWATEAIRVGEVPGIEAMDYPDFIDFVVDRFNSNDAQPARVFLRPKTPFGI